MIKNIYKAEAHREVAHGGPGEALNTLIFGAEMFESGLEFVIYTELELGAGIGYHPHGEDEEIYLVLEGEGRMTVNGEIHQVQKGDVILNRPGGATARKTTGPRC